MYISWVLVLTLLGCAAASVLPQPRDGAEEEDTNMEPLDIIRKYGYPAEEHTVQTDDGYLLTMHRIPYGRLCGADRSRGPVLVKHGLFSSSVDWFIAGTEHGLAYILADNCYDVWLGNARGNTFSKAHAYLDVHSPEYWKFSWHEIGVYDIPAEIDYILHKTGKKDLLYIGHSQGTTSYFVFNSMLPEYGEKVRGAFLLAPVAFMGHNKSFVLDAIAKFQDMIGWIANTLGLYEFAPHSEFLTEMGGALCNDSHPVSQDMCGNFLFIICGFDSDQLNGTMLPIYMGHLPAGASTRQVLHYAQNINTGLFSRYDFGKKENQEVYGQDVPPEYVLSQMTIPTNFYYSENDWLAATVDVENAAALMGSFNEKYLIPYPKFNHLDYIVATDVVTLLYNKLLADMSTF